MENFFKSCFYSIGAADSSGIVVTAYNAEPQGTGTFTDGLELIPGQASAL